VSRILAVSAIIAFVAAQLAAVLQPAVAETLIPVSSVTANGTDTFPSNPPTVLVADAQGDYLYSPPNPGGGGGGTSWHTYSSDGSPPIILTFNFSQSANVNELVLWDYYGHSPSDWTIKLYSGPSATGSELLSYDFSIGTGQNYDPLRWVVDFPNTYNVDSAALSTRSNSHWGGVGLSEVAFVVPEPTSMAIFIGGCFFVAIASPGRHFRRRS
jgi:hypothetical protein